MRTTPASASRQLKTALPRVGLVWSCLRRTPLQGEPLYNAAAAKIFAAACRLHPPVLHFALGSMYEPIVEGERAGVVRGLLRARADANSTARAV